MALVSFRYGNEADIKALQDIIEGALYFAQDTGALYVGSSSNNLIPIIGDIANLNQIIDSRVSSKLQEKVVNSSAKAQKIVPDDDALGLESVTINAMPYKETANSSGGTTVEIG